MMPTCPNSVLHLVARLSAVGVCLGCLELLSHGLRPRKTAGRGGEEPPQEKAVRWGAGTWHVGLLALAAARLVLGALLLCDPGVGLYWKYYVVGLLILTFLLCLRIPLTKGADAQMTLITYSAMALTLFSDTPVVAGYCLYFLTLQLCLAYSASGFHKLRSSSWRSGHAMPALLSARLFGFPALGVWLVRHRWCAWSLAWATIVWEVSFPVVLVAPREIGLGYLACGVLFHLGTAFAMGLNKFIWAFIALYPAAIYCTMGSLPLAPWGGAG
jgi:hypothetical protein